MFEQHKAALVHDDDFHEEVSWLPVFPRIFYREQPPRINAVENEQLLHQAVFCSSLPLPLSLSLFLYFFFFSFHVRDVKNQTTLFPPSLSFISGTGRVACGGQGRVLTSRRQCPRTCTPFDTDIIDETIVSHSASLSPRSLFESERNYGKGDETKDWWKWCGFSILEMHCFGVSPLFDCRLIDI